MLAELGDVHVNVVDNDNEHDRDEKNLKDMAEFLRCVGTLSHLKVKREKPFKYFHHYIIVAISKVRGKDEDENKNVHSITVGQYTSSGAIFTESSNGIGKFVQETYFIDSNNIRDGGDVDNLFDFATGVYLVQKKDHPTTVDTIKEAFYRLDERIGERMYAISSNNCEHAINYIITGKSFSQQSDENKISKVCFIDFMNVTLVDCKEVGLKTALFVAAIGAIAGSLVRRAYVTIIVAAIVSLTLGNEPIVCGYMTGLNIRTEAETSIDLAESMKYINIVVANKSIDTLAKLKDHLHTEFICTLAENLVKDAAYKTAFATVTVSVGIETIFFASFVFFNLLYRREMKTLKDKKLCRILFLDIFAGYGSIMVTVLGGYFAFLCVTRPALYYFLIVCSCSVISRYFLTCLAGQIFNLCCCSFWWNRYESFCCTVGCVKCCHKEICWFRLSTISFIILAVCFLITMIFLLFKVFWDVNLNT